MVEALNGTSPGDLEALRHLTSVEPFIFLSPNSDLSHSARCASRYLFSSLAPFCPKSPFDRLLVDGFDAEQIWQQIDLQTQHLIPSLRRKLNQFKRNPDGISKFLSGPKVESRKSEEGGAEAKEMVISEEEGDGFEDGGDEEVSDDEDGDEEEDEAEGEDEEEDEAEGEDEEEEEGDGVRDVEDQFLKIKELEKYLEKDERKEYSEGNGGNDEDDEEDDAEDDDDIDIGDGDINDIRYEDFFGSKEKGTAKKKVQRGKLEDLDIDDDEDEEEGEDDENDDNLDKQNEKVLSTHEKQLEKMRSKIEQMEKANLEPKTWTMQGEVTAAKRPKNSALEVDLDFEHNVRPAPVITEEVTSSLEDLIKKRIIEGHFDDVQKPPQLLTAAPKALKELDENKSKKGLAEIYEEEYAQKTGLASAPPSYADEQKKEANLLFKRLCIKLDALSHFHFAPKPVIEDMSIQSNIPALAMEEIAPLAVSDAAMLAPEEIFSGKGDIKEDAELTQEEKRRRRANRKRKHNAGTIKPSAAKKSHKLEH